MTANCDEYNSKPKYTPASKGCAECCRHLPHSAFYLHRSAPHGLMGWCIECNAVHKAAKKYQQKHGLPHVREVPQSVRDEARELHRRKHGQFADVL